LYRLGSGSAGEAVVGALKMNRSHAAIQTKRFIRGVSFGGTVRAVGASRRPCYSTQSGAKKPSFPDANAAHQASRMISDFGIVSARLKTTLSVSLPGVAAGLASLTCRPGFTLGVWLTR